MKKIMGGIALLALLMSAALAADEPAAKPKTEEPKKAEATVMKDTTAAKVTTAKEHAWTTTKSGLKYRDMIVGKGAEAKMSMPVNCNYTVWLSDKDGKKGKMVQSSKGGKPFQCTVGQNLIEGWSEGMVGMKEGGTRELIVPPALGWGNRDVGNGMIPANSTVFFEIEFLNQVKP